MDTRTLMGNKSEKMRQIALAIVEAKEKAHANNAKEYREAYEKQYGKSDETA